MTPNIREFPLLPVLERLCEAAENAGVCPPSNMVVVGVQHMLSTTGSLVNSLIQMGVEPHRIFLAGKAYSSHLETCLRLRTSGVHIEIGTTPDGPGDYSRALRRDVRALWHDAAEMINGNTTCIVLDDGGFCIREAPSWVAHGKVIGIEQTTSGLGIAGKVNFPVIGVASSAAKTLIEPPLIANAIINKLRTTWSLDLEGTCGIIGCGSIGRALIERLAQEGVEVVDDDRDPARLRHLPLPRKNLCESPQDLYSAAGYIFGCTGSDVSPAPSLLNRLSGQKILISCSSGDREFRKLVLWLARRSNNLIQNRGGEEEVRAPFGALVGESRNWKVEILNGGYPVNFDRSAESVPAGEIQITRGLLLGALLQAVLCSEPVNTYGIYSRSIMLSPLLQCFVVREWLSVNSEVKEVLRSNLIDMFSDAASVAKHSGGSKQECQEIASFLAGYG